MPRRTLRPSPPQPHALLGAGLLAALLVAGAGCQAPPAPPDLQSCADANCISCNVDDDCRFDKRKICLAGLCVECTNDAQCGPGRACDLTTNQCSNACGPQNPCGDGGVCEVDSGACLGCVQNADCKDPANPICDPVKFGCIPCVRGSRDLCSTGTYCADQGGTNRCVPGCKGDPDCAMAPGKKCEMTKSQCVECAADGDCDMGKVCVQNRCNPGCNNNQPCPQGLTCCADRCVDQKSDDANCGACGRICPNEEQCCGGKCSDPISDVVNCGGCGIACSVANGVPRCASGTCQVAFCDKAPPPMGGQIGRDEWSDCNGIFVDGCETHLRTNVNHCNACNQACSIPNATAKCDEWQCKVNACVDPWGDCDKNGKDCEIQLDTNATHCGGCGQACSANHVTALCRNKECVGACDNGFADCDGSKRGNGCEQDILGSTNHCGKCGNVCSSVNGTASCTAGACKVACANLYDDCDKDVTTGCETSLRSLIHCGQCGKSCVLAHANPTCGDGTCKIGTCEAGWENCGGGDPDGCETQIATNVMNCGACGKACSTNNAQPRCNAGVCFVSCAPGFADCNINAADGCEIDATLDVANCGACGRACNLPNTLSHACAGGACQIQSCRPGYRDCNTTDGDGCEVDVTADVNNCGGCGQACSRNNGTPSCVALACKINCNPGFGDCDGNAANGCEVDLRSTAVHCGACGATCSNNHVPTPACTVGSCSGACEAGFADCNNNKRADGCEVNVATDVKNCGTCGNGCSNVNGTPSCLAGACKIGCAMGFDDCDSDVRTGCETALNSNTNCGGCGVKCAAPNAITSCGTGACKIGSCAPGFADCDGNLGNGCEVDITTSTGHCGACGTICNSTKGTASCVASACRITCDNGFANCDGNAATGCEVATANNVDNCGGCGNVCSRANGTPSCTNGACQIACAPDWANCDGDVRTGCETPLNTTQNCGACGTACNAASAISTCSKVVNAWTCQILACANNFADCNSSYNDGCEARTDTSAANCGGCGRACSPGNLTPTCSGGQCTGACNPGFADCNNDKRSDGCEASTAADPAHCGGCDLRCSSQNMQAVTCGGGNCNGTCTANFADCNGDKRSDGCEVNVQTSGAHCGGCNAACSPNNVVAPSCAAGNCTSACAPGFASCDGDLRTNGCETDITNPNNCGGCARVCTNNNVATRNCAGGACSVTCAVNFADCDGNKDAPGSNGCEIRTDNNLAHCGGCNRACATGNANAQCIAGACNVTCNANFLDCDNNKDLPNSNGCEVNKQTDPNNCGTCGVKCLAPNANCVAGVCAP